MELTNDQVQSFKKLLMRPYANGLEFPPLDQIFTETEEASDREELYKDYLKRTGLKKSQLTKEMFLRIMDITYPQKPTKDGELGYCVEFTEENQTP